MSSPIRQTKNLFGTSKPLKCLMCVNRFVCNVYQPKQILFLSLETGKILKAVFFYISELATN